MENSRNLESGPSVLRVQGRDPILWMSVSAEAETWQCPLASNGFSPGRFQQMRQRGIARTRKQL